MTKSLFPGFDGLMSLSRREGVDVRPTLLRVLTDLYVQTSTHSEDEQRQFIELATRLIDQVDDATRAAVKARLAIYPKTPVPVLQKLGLVATQEGRRVPLAREIPVPPPAPAPVRAPTEAEQRMAANLAMQPKEAAEIHDMFFRAGASERALILHNLAQTPLKAAPRIPTVRARRAIQILEMAAIAGDIENFTFELGDLALARRGPDRRRCRRRGARGRRPCARHAEPGLPAHPVVLQAGDRHLRQRRVPAVAALRSPQRSLGAGDAGSLARLGAGRHPRQISVLVA